MNGWKSLFSLFLLSTFEKKETFFLSKLEVTDNCSFDSSTVFRPSSPKQVGLFNVLPFPIGCRKPIQVLPEFVLDAHLSMVRETECSFGVSGGTRVTTE